MAAPKKSRVVGAFIERTLGQTPTTKEMPWQTRSTSTLAKSLTKKSPL